MMTAITKRRILYAAAGLLYGAVLAAWGLLPGGGNFDLPMALAGSPAGLGFLFWPVLAYLSAGRPSTLSRFVFLCAASAHYFGLIRYFFHEGSGDLHWFKVFVNDSLFILSFALLVIAYLAGQVLLWVTFWRAAEGPSRRGAVRAGGKGWR